MPFCYCRMHTKAAQHHLRHRLPCVHRGRLASPPTRAASWHGRAWPQGADPCVPGSDQVTYWSVPCRLAAEEGVRRLRSSISNINAVPPIRAVRGSCGGVGSALFVLLRGPKKGAPQQARAWGYPSQSRQPALGRWSCLYRAYRVLRRETRKNERFCTNYSHN